MTEVQNLRFVRPVNLESTSQSRIYFSYHEALSSNMIMNSYVDFGGLNKTNSDLVLNVLCHKRRHLPHSSHVFTP